MTITISFAVPRRRTLRRLARRVGRPLVGLVLTGALCTASLLVGPDNRAYAASCQPTGSVLGTSTCIDLSPSMSSIDKTLNLSLGKTTFPKVTVPSTIANTHIDRCLFTPTAAGCQAAPINRCLLTPNANGCKQPPVNPCLVNPKARGCAPRPVNPCLVNLKARGCAPRPIDPCLVNPKARGCVQPPVNRCLVNPLARGCGSIVTAQNGGKSPPEKKPVPPPKFPDNSPQAKALRTKATMQILAACMNGLGQALGGTAGATDPGANFGSVDPTAITVRGQNGTMQSQLPKHNKAQQKRDSKSVNNRVKRGGRC
jgi:hypothetical protein